MKISTMAAVLITIFYLAPIGKVYGQIEQKKLSTDKYAIEEGVMYKYHGQYWESGKFTPNFRFPVSDSDKSLLPTGVIGRIIMKLSYWELFLDPILRYDLYFQIEKDNAYIEGIPYVIFIEPKIDRDIKYRIPKHLTVGMQFKLKVTTSTTINTVIISKNDKIVKVVGNRIIVKSKGKTFIVIKAKGNKLYNPVFIRVPIIIK